MGKTEVLPVPPELVPKVWKSVRNVALSKIPNYDIERTHMRLLAGVDQLWVSYDFERLTGVIITSISMRPPQKRKCFWREDPALMKSLTIHLTGSDRGVESWIDSAVERISRYAREHGCHQLFLMMSKGWTEYAKRFWAPEWEAVAVSRDRPTTSTCYDYRGRNTPGHFRLLKPVPREQFSIHRYRLMWTLEFPLEAA